MNFPSEILDMNKMRVKVPEFLLPSFHWSFENPLCNEDCSLVEILKLNFGQKMEVNTFKLK